MTIFLFLILKFQAYKTIDNSNIIFHSFLIALPFQCIAVQPCDPLAKCQNLSPGYMCTACPEGWTSPPIRGVGLEFARRNRQVWKIMLLVHYNTPTSMRTLLHTEIHFFFLDSMFISVEDRTRGIRFSCNYRMSFTYSQIVITKQAGNTLYTRSYNLKDQNM